MRAVLGGAVTLVIHEARLGAAGVSSMAAGRVWSGLREGAPRGRECVTLNGIAICLLLERGVATRSDDP
jgi:hypothetical protein